MTPPTPHPSSFPFLPQVYFRPSAGFESYPIPTRTDVHTRRWVRGAGSAVVWWGEGGGRGVLRWGKGGWYSRGGYNRYLHGAKYFLFLYSAFFIHSTRTTHRHGHTHAQTHPLPAVTQPLVPPLGHLKNNRLFLPSTGLCRALRHLQRTPPASLSLDHGLTRRI